jgi:sarcosine/dimethylglycine N-methyltransferase
MNTQYSMPVETARDYYNSADADNFYYQIWGGEDIHIGLYEDQSDAISVASKRTVAAMARQLTNLDRESRVIDLGAGYGGSARWLAMGVGCRVCCVNLSEAQNARNRLANRSQGLEGLIEVCDGNFEDIPYDDDMFDVAWSQDSILHTSRRARVLDEVDRVLKPGGEFVFTDPMQADDCPAGVLQPVLDRIHLESLGSFGFYREQARRLGWDEVGILDLSPHLVRHYTRVRQELALRRETLEVAVSREYIDRMIRGLAAWIDAGDNGYLTWGIMHFRKRE